MSESNELPPPPENITIGSPEDLSYRDKLLSYSLEYLTTPRMARMAESVFRVKFLPFFRLEGLTKETLDGLLAGIHKSIDPRPDEATLRSIIIREYLTEIGDVRNAYNEIEVYDSEGKVVFTLPPLFVRTEGPLLDPRVPLDRVLTQAANQALVHQKLGDRVIEENLIPFIATSEVSSEWVEQWNRVYAYYGTKQYVLSEEHAEAQGDDVSKTDTNGAVVLDDYDDDF